VPNAVCRLLEERAIPTIYGNCDYVPSVVEDWDIEDPAGKPIDELRVIRDQIEARVQDLARNRMTRSGRCPSDRS
jgi:hypothetical protein